MSDAAEKEIDTFNRFMVGVRADKIAIMNMPTREMTKEDALGLAAWLVALADDHDEFPKILAAVRDT